MRTPFRRAARNHGFTLIELLVVIAIIALLVAILLPSLGRAKMMAKMAVCTSNMRSLSLALIMYGNESGRLPTSEPDWSYWDCNIATKPVSSITEAELPKTWLGKLQKSQKLSRLSNGPFKCPIQTATWNDNSPFRTDYVMNTWAIGRQPDSCKVPPKAVLLAHPNMLRHSVWYMNCSVACFSRDNPGLEQGATGASSFGFADGHAANLKVGPSTAGKHQAGDAEDARWFKQDIWFYESNPPLEVYSNWFGEGWPKAAW